MSQIVGTRDVEETVVVRSCDMCRKKKIRCEATGGACLQCTKYKTECHFTPIIVRRKQKRPSGNKRVEKLEQRLKWMEEQLEQAKKRSKPELEFSPRTSRELGLPIFSQLQTERIMRGDDNQYFSPVSTSLHSPTRQTSFHHTIDRQSHLGLGNQISISPWYLTSSSNDALARPLKGLPPRNEAAKLIEKSFQQFNSAFPLFDKASFMHNFDGDFSDPGWWACLNVMLALTHRFGYAPAQDAGEDIDATGYFQNALAVSSHLTTTHASFLSVQALVGMAMVMFGTPNQGPAPLMLSSAIKLSQSMDLHRKVDGQNLSVLEQEQRKRVFWIAYLLDKDFSLQTGQPPTQDEDHMDLDLPEGNELFTHRIRLALIQGQIYKRLLSVKAGKQTLAERAMAKRELETTLDAWKSSAPIDFNKDHRLITNDLPASKHPAVGFRLAYYHSLASIQKSLTSVRSNSEMIGSPSGVSISYVAEARKALTMLRFTPRRHNACIWAVFRIYVSAAMTLLSYTISNNSNSLARDDTALAQPLITLLGILSQNSVHHEIGQMYQSCSTLFERAQLATGNVEEVNVNWKQLGPLQKPGEKESIEDFLRRIDNISSEYSIEFQSVLPDSMNYVEGS